MKMQNNYSDEVYVSCMKILRDIKLLYGPSYVTGTLRHHPSLRSFLVEYQANLLDSIEVIVDESLDKSQAH